MSFMYGLSNCCGTPFNTGNIKFVDKTDLLAVPSGNRVTLYNLKHNIVQLCPFEARHHIEHVLFSPTDPIALIIDQVGCGLVVNLINFTIFAYPKFKHHITYAAYSPCGKYFVLAMNRLMKIYASPSASRNWQCILLATTRNHLDQILHIDWSSDSKFLCTASKDLTVRILSREHIPDYRPITFVDHRCVVRGAYFTSDMNRVVSVASDGTMIIWSRKENSEEPSVGHHLTTANKAFHYYDSEMQALDPYRKLKRKILSEPQTIHSYCHSSWTLESKGYCQQPPGSFVQTSCLKSSFFLVGFTNGSARLYELPSLNSLYAVNIGHYPLTTVDINHDGEWIALGCSHAEQLCVFEWKSESFILKQQQHISATIRCVACSPVMNAVAYAKYGGDISSVSTSSNVVVATGGEDGKVKLWDTASGFNYITFAEHTACVNALVFAPQGNAVFSASSDGSIRAFDLARYRNFATFVAPDEILANFTCLAINTSGEILIASASDSIYIWSVQTKKLLGSYNGHEHCVTALQFHPHPSKEGIVVSTSLDKTIMVWNIYEDTGKGAKPELLVNQSGVTSGAIDPRGNNQLAVATSAGNIWFWDIEEGRILGSIDGLRDIKSGRGDFDQTTANQWSKLSKAVRRQHGSVGSKVDLTQHFTTLAYSNTGFELLAGSKHSTRICVYCTTHRHLLHVYCLTNNRSLSGIHPELSSRFISETGKPLYAYDVSDDDEENHEFNRQAQIRAHQALPGVNIGDLKTKQSSRDRFITCQVIMSQDGQQWYAATSQGLFVYSIGHGRQTHRSIYRHSFDQFSPVLVTKNVNYENIVLALQQQFYSKALILSLGLNEYSILKCVYQSIPYDDIPIVAQSIPPYFVPILLNFIRVCLSFSSQAAPAELTRNQADKTLYIQCHVQWLLILLSLYAPMLQCANYGPLIQKKSNQNTNPDLLQQFGTVASGEIRTICLLLLKSLMSIHHLMDTLFGYNLRLIEFLTCQSSRSHSLC